MRRLVVALCMIAGLGGCAGQQIQSCSPGYGSPFAVFTLFFGRSISGRDDLTDKEWLEFVDTTINAELPGGYTMWDANGGWMNRRTHSTMREATKVLAVALPEVPESLAAIERVRTAYESKFNQQLVGMIIDHACGVF